MTPGLVSLFVSWKVSNNTKGVLNNYTSYKTCSEQLHFIQKVL